MRRIFPGKVHKILNALLKKQIQTYYEKNNDYGCGHLRW